MTLWSQTLDEVVSTHPLYGLTAKGPMPAILGVLGGFGLSMRYDAPLPGILIGLLLILMPWLVTRFVDRRRIRFQIAQGQATRFQGKIEQALSFGTTVDYTLTRGPLRRALNLPGVLHLNSQTGVMRSWSLTWPIAAQNMPALDAALTQALKGETS
ncbi:hypothetical protein [Thalassovita sp.]|jgi:hypothetical protein|uniref:hypothetical protein n=1 Tax=Thalassovita sp. TaxID=1979401 RepID=UPI003B5915C1